MTKCRWSLLQRDSLEDYIDSKYKRLIGNARGRKLIQVLRLLTEGIMTKKEIARRTGFSASEVRELVKKGLVDGYIERRTKEIRGKPGRLPNRGQRKRAGRPSYYYYLNGDGKWLIRLDPEVRDRWDEVEIAYEKLIEHTIFDSYANLVYAIRKNAELRKYQKADYFMDDELQRTVLNPFLYVGEYGAKEATQLYDELVRVIKISVRSEDVIGYYSALEESLKELNTVVDCHKALMEKMRTLPEVQEYLCKHV